jgi:hypothetical protein
VKLGKIYKKYEQYVNCKIVTIVYEINDINIDSIRPIRYLAIENSFINTAINTINYREYADILKKNINYMELFLNLCVIIVYRALITLKFTFQNKDMIKKDKLKFISYSAIYKNFLNNSLLGIPVPTIITLLRSWR